MRCLGVAVGLALLVACERDPLVDGLGGGGDGMMVWGRRIAFGSAAGVVVADPETGDVEILDDRSTHVLLRDADGLISTPGECLAGCAVPAVHVGFDGGVSTIVDGVLALGLHTVVVASNGASLAFVPADDLATLPTFVVFDRATASETAVRPGYPMAFSPDGAEVLFNEGTPNTEQIVDLATGDVRSAGFDFDPEALESLLAVKWGDDLEALASSPELGGDETIWHLRRVGPAGGRASIFASDEEISGPFTFSLVGRRVAFWTSRCVNFEGLACVEERFTLRSVALEGGRDEVVGHADFAAGPIYYDPPGEHLAWETAGDLFVARVR